jgi:signal transduction histidine kinase
MSDQVEFEKLQRDTEKMKALQQFIQGTTQEIKGPLHALFQKCQYLVDKYKDRSFEYIGYKEFKEIIAVLETIRDHSKHSVDTVDQLVSLNKKKAGLKGNHCDANHVVHEAVKMLRYALEVSNISIVLKLAPSLPNVAIGSLELNQVVINVLTNAIQAVPGGGKIEIKTHMDTSRRVCFEFKDNGVGIPKDSLSRIFEPFFTAKPRGLEKSTGLGLSIVYSIVKSYGGDIIIQSSLRQGTNVKICLPAFKGSKAKK